VQVVQHRLALAGKTQARNAHARPVGDEDRRRKGQNTGKIVTVEISRDPTPDELVEHRVVADHDIRVEERAERRQEAHDPTDAGQQNDTGAGPANRGQNINQDFIRGRHIPTGGRAKVGERSGYCPVVAGAGRDHPS
jgi:hypothetical protein